MFYINGKRATAERRVNGMTNEVNKQLLDALLEKVHENNSKRVFLEVVAENKPAISLYLSRKFEQIAKRSNYYPDGSDAVIMQLDLRSK